MENKVLMLNYALMYDKLTLGWDLRIRIICVEISGGECILGGGLFLTFQSPRCFNTIELSERDVMAGRRGERVLVLFSESGGIGRMLTTD